MPKNLIVIVKTIVLLPALCFGWDREGHQIVATVAENHLDETTKVMVLVARPFVPTASGKGWAPAVGRRNRFYRRDR